MDNNDTQSLINILQTRRIIGRTDVGDTWNVEVYNMEEQLIAAEKLGKLGDQNALPALAEFFCGCVSNLNTVYDSDNSGTHTLSYPSDLRRIAKAIVSISGEKGFGAILKKDIIQCVIRMTAWDTKFYSDSYIIEKNSKKIIFLYKEFGNVGNWLAGLREGLNNDSVIVRSIASQTLRTCKWWKFWK